MASAVLGPHFDIHTGGIDLKFPHHDNEIAQAEAHYDSDVWVNYFLHSGHLTIAGCKMSKSLKNFVTIQQALEKYTSRQIRLLFLLHSWSSTLDYSDHGMEKALNYEKMLNEFFLNIKTHLRPMKQLNYREAYQKFEEYDLTLNERFSKIKIEIHLALCDSIDTPTVMELIRQLVSLTNIYMNTTNVNINLLLLRNISVYITSLINIFGLNSSASFLDDIGFTRSTEQQASTVNVEDIAMPFVQAFSEFRDAVRTQAITTKNVEILKLCDCVRNDTLPELGVRLEDQAGTNKATIKFCDPEELRREREQALLVEKSKQEEKERKQLEQKLAKEAKERKQLEQQLAKEAKEAKKKESKDKKNVNSKDPSQENTAETVVNGAAAVANGDA
jgi:cysteinyl-tRNA synthetase